MFGLAIAKIKSGFGRHIYYLSPKQITFALKLEYIVFPLFMLSCMFTRMSICLFLIRIFTINLVWKRVLYIILAFIVATGASSAIIALPQCNPVAKFWKPTINGTCWSQDLRIRLFYFKVVRPREDALRSTHSAYDYLSKGFPSSPTFYWLFCPFTS